MFTVKGNQADPLQREKTGYKGLRKKQEEKRENGSQETIHLTQDISARYDSYPYNNTKQAVNDTREVDERESQRCYSVKIQKKGKSDVKESSEDQRKDDDQLVKSSDGDTGSSFGQGISTKTDGAQGGKTSPSFEDQMATDEREDGGDKEVRGENGKPRASSNLLGGAKIQKRGKSDAKKCSDDQRKDDDQFLQSFDGDTGSSFGQGIFSETDGAQDGKTSPSVEDQTATEKTEKGGDKEVRGENEKPRASFNSVGGHVSSEKHGGSCYENDLQPIEELMDPLAGNYSDSNDTEEDETMFGEALYDTGFTDTEDSTEEADQRKKPDETMKSTIIKRKRVPSSSSSCSSKKSFGSSKQRKRRMKQRVTLSSSDDEEHSPERFYQNHHKKLKFLLPKHLPSRPRSLNPGSLNLPTQQIQNELTFTAIQVIR